MTTMIKDNKDIITLRKKHEVFWKYIIKSTRYKVDNFNIQETLN